MENRHFPIIGVGVVVLNNRNEILLIKRGTEPNIGIWTIPGGRQEAGESLATTAHREIEEETGVIIGTPKLIDVVDHIEHNPDGTLLRHYSLIDYAARYLNGKPRAGGDAACAAWVSLAEIDKYITWSETLRIIKKAVMILNADS